tara:strand:+ start:132 stop:785 length:654 start_codon:yes stop_codon:yes gene_type:complete
MSLLDSYLIGKYLLTKKVVIGVVVFAGLIFSNTIYKNFHEEYSTASKLENIAEEAPTVENFRNVSYHYYTHESWEEAISFATKGLEISPNELWLNSIIGRSYVELRNFDLAILYLQREVKANSDCELEYYWLGMSLNRVEEYSKALMYLKKITTRKKSRVMIEAIREEGSSYQGLGKTKEACKCWNSIENRDTDASYKYELFCIKKEKLENKVRSPH